MQSAFLFEEIDVALIHFHPKNSSHAFLELRYAKMKLISITLKGRLHEFYRHRF